MNSLYIILIISYHIQITLSWSAILLDGNLAKTQLYIPASPPISLSNVNFNLPHLYAAAGVVLDGVVYIVGGWNYTNGQAVNTVYRFDTANNRTTNGVF